MGLFNRKYFLNNGKFLKILICILKRPLLTRLQKNHSIPWRIKAFSGSSKFGPVFFFFFFFFFVYSARFRQLQLPIQQLWGSGEDIISNFKFRCLFFFFFFFLFCFYFFKRKWTFYYPSKTFSRFSSSVFVCFIWSWNLDVWHFFIRCVLCKDKRIYDLMNN